MEALAEFRKNIKKYVEMCDYSGKIDQTLYSQYDVKRGLRDSDGKGVLTGLTEISDVSGFKVDTAFVLTCFLNNKRNRFCILSCLEVGNYTTANHWLSS